MDRWLSTRGRSWFWGIWGLMLAVVAVLVASTVNQVAEDTTSLGADVVVVGVYLTIGLRDKTIGGLIASAVGPAWLATTLWPAVTAAHVGLLFAAVLAHASVFLEVTAVRVLVAMVAGLLATGVLAGLGSSLAFAGGAVVILWARPLRAGDRYVLAAAWAQATVTAFLWWDDWRTGGLSPQVRLTIYQLTLLACGVLLLASVIAAQRYRRGLTNLLLAGSGDGLSGLQRELSTVLGDEALRIERIDGDPTPAAGIVILDGDRVVATVVSEGALLRDPLIVAAVTRAVRLTLRNSELHAEQTRYLAELESGRGVLQRTVDEARRFMRQSLQVEVATPLLGLLPCIDSLSGAAPQVEAAAAMQIAAAEIATAVDEVAALLEGLPPRDLGQGQVMTALARVVASSPVPVRLLSGPGAAFTATVETTLYYVCCEAIANAVKHSGASHIECRVAVADSQAVATVSDDGRGGADLLGSGLQGLRDRVESMHGRLRVTSPLGIGTTVTALVPLS